MRHIFKVDLAKNAGKNWLVADLGRDVDNKNYILTTDHVQASEASYYLQTAKIQGELIANLLNWYWSNPKVAQQQLQATEKASAPE